MRNITIQFKKRTAIVSLEKKAYMERSYGLIQYLSSFCDNITWEVLDAKEDLGVKK